MICNIGRLSGFKISEILQEEKRSGDYMLLYIIRHGDPNYEKDTITSKGHEEANSLAKRMVKVKPDLLYSSPLGRAKDTAKYTSDILNIDFGIQEWTQEIDSVIEHSSLGRMSAWDIPGEVIFEEDSDLVNDMYFSRPYLQRANIKEKFETLRKNSDVFLEEHGYKRIGRRYRCINSNNIKIVIFCHMGFGLAWLSHLLNVPLGLMWVGFSLAPTSVSIVSFEEASSNWAVPRCIALGDTAHIYESGLS